MANNISSTAMVLAAGKGLRMRPLTLETPKPLLEVGGRTMLDTMLDRLKAFGIKRAVVNTHHLPEKIEAHLKNRHDIEIVISREDELLETGGGIKKARANFDEPFFALNADLPWTEGKTPALSRMAASWDPAKMDVLLLLTSRDKAEKRGFGTKGDFKMESDGRLHRLDVQPPYPYVMIGAQIVKPDLFGKVSEKIFSNNIIWDAAEHAGRLYGIAHDGACYHIGTPEDLLEANRLLATKQGWG